MKIQSILLVSLALWLSGCFSVNSSIEIDDGSVVEDGLKTVNGRIAIGADCEIGGDVSTVNGSIRIGPATSAGAIHTTNGSITLDQAVEAESVATTNGRVRIGNDARIGESVGSTNGSIELDAGARVSGAVETSNGHITAAEGVIIADEVRSNNGRVRLTGVDVRFVSTANGPIELLDGTHVRDGLEVRPVRGTTPDEPPRIIIGRDVVVDGPLRFEREVELWVHESARIGEVEGAEARVYSGDRPGTDQP